MSFVGFNVTEFLTSAKFYRHLSFSYDIALTFSRKIQSE